MEKERRISPIPLQCEEREALGDGTNSRVLVGYPIVFNSLSSDLGGWRERILPSAVTSTLGADDIVALWNHNDGMVLGRVSAGTLKLSADSDGVQAEMSLPDSSWGSDALEAVRRGDVLGMSFRFSVLPDGSEWRYEGDTLVREISNLRLYEVSPVVFPAYPATSVSVRSRAVELTRGRTPDDRILRLSLRLTNLETLLGV